MGRAVILVLFYIMENLHQYLSAKRLKILHLFLLINLLSAALLSAQEPQQITHLVRPSDTLSSISKEYSVSIEDILLLNSLKLNKNGFPILSLNSKIILSQIQLTQKYSPELIYFTSFNRSLFLKSH